MPLTLQISPMKASLGEGIFFFFLAAISRWTVLENFPEERHFGLTFGQRGRAL